jgi:hypothetical protein
MNHQTGQRLGTLMGMLGVCLGGLIAAGCEDMHQSVDYDRHTLSSLRTSYQESDIIIFEAKLTPEAPEDSEAGEAVRMQWLEGWLRQRGLCPNGYEIRERRPYRREDANPYRYDLRYEVSCKAAQAAE